MLKLGDHGHVRSWIGEVRLGQVRLGFRNNFKQPLYNPIMKVLVQYPNCFPSLRLCYNCVNHGYVCSRLGEVSLDHVRLGIINELKGSQP